MELVASALAAERRNHIAIGHCLWKVGQHHVIERCADASLLGLLQLTGKDGDVIRVQPQVVAEVVVNLLEAATPEFIVRV